MTAHCHKMIRQVAQAAAGELYETVMGNNLVFEEWKRKNPGLTPKQLENRFIAKYWGSCIDFARATLTTMLTKGLDSATEEAIMEALVLDATLLRGRVQETKVIGTLGTSRQ